jgi:nitroreductase
MDVYEAVRTRRAVRGFIDRPVPVKGLERVVSAATWAPSIGNMLRIRFPTDWPAEERYEFRWPDLSAMEDPFVNFDYARHA